MNAVSEFEQLWIPVHVENVEKGADRVVVYPKHAVVKLRGTVRVVVEQSL